MEPNRNGEQGPVPQRHQRLYKEGDRWYIATREAPIGPFSKLSEAVTICKAYVRQLKHGGQSDIASNGHY